MTTRRPSSTVARSPSSVGGGRASPTYTAMNAISPQYQHQSRRGTVTMMGSAAGSSGTSNTILASPSPSRGPPQRKVLATTSTSQRNVDLHGDAYKNRMKRLLWSTVPETFLAKGYDGAPNPEYNRSDPRITAQDARRIVTVSKRLTDCELSLAPPQHVPEDAGEMTRRLGMLHAYALVEPSREDRARRRRRRGARNLSSTSPNQNPSSSFWGGAGGGAKGEGEEDDDDEDSGDSDGKGGALMRAGEKGMSLERRRRERWLRLQREKRQAVLRAEEEAKLSRRRGVGVNFAPLSSKVIRDHKRLQEEEVRMQEAKAEEEAEVRRRAADAAPSNLLATRACHTGYVRPQSALRAKEDEAARQLMLMEEFSSGGGGGHSSGGEDGDHRHHGGGGLAASFASAASTSVGPMSGVSNGAVATGSKAPHQQHSSAGGRRRSLPVGHLQPPHGATIANASGFSYVEVPKGSGGSHTHAHGTNHSSPVGPPPSSASSAAAAAASASVVTSTTTTTISIVPNAHFLPPHAQRSQKHKTMVEEEASIVALMANGKHPLLFRSPQKTTTPMLSEAEVRDMRGRAEEAMERHYNESPGSMRGRRSTSPPLLLQRQQGEEGRHEARRLPSPSANASAAAGINMSGGAPARNGGGGGGSPLISHMQPLDVSDARADCHDDDDDDQEGQHHQPFPLYGDPDDNPYGLQYDPMLRRLNLKAAARQHRKQHHHNGGQMAGGSSLRVGGGPSVILQASAGSAAVGNGSFSFSNNNSFSSSLHRHRPSQSKGAAAMTAIMAAKANRRTTLTTNGKGGGVGGGGDGSRGVGPASSFSEEGGRTPPAGGGDDGDGEGGKETVPSDGAEVAPMRLYARKAPAPTVTTTTSTTAASAESTEILLGLDLVDLASGAGEEASGEGCQQQQETARPPPQHSAVPADDVRGGGEVDKCGESEAGGEMLMECVAMAESAHFTPSNVAITDGVTIGGSVVLGEGVHGTDNKPPHAAVSTTTQSKRRQLNVPVGAPSRPPPDGPPMDYCLILSDPNNNANARLNKDGKGRGRRQQEKRTDNHVGSGDEDSDGGKVKGGSSSSSSSSSDGDESGDGSSTSSPAKAPKRTILRAPRRSRWMKSFDTALMMSEALHFVEEARSKPPIARCGPNETSAKDGELSSRAVIPAPLRLSVPVKYAQETREKLELAHMPRLVAADGSDAMRGAYTLRSPSRGGGGGGGDASREEFMVGRPQPTRARSPLPSASILGGAGSGTAAVVSSLVVATSPPSPSGALLAVSRGTDGDVTVATALSCSSASHRPPSPYHRPPGSQGRRRLFTPSTGGRLSPMHT